MRRPRLLLNLVTFAVMGFVSAPAFAQAPMRPLFGRTSGDTEQTLSAGFSIGQGLFQTRALEGDTDGQTYRRDTSLTFATASLTYSLSGERTGLSASLASTGRYFSEETNTLLDGHSGNVNGWLQISNRTRLTVGQAVLLGPAHQGGLAGLTDPTANFRPDLVVGVNDSTERILRFRTDASLTQDLSRRSSVSLTYGRDQREFEGEDLTQVSETVRGSYRHQLAAGLSARLGYGHHTNRVTGDIPGEARRTRDQHTIEAGLDFNRALSLDLSRRTTVTFGVGTAITQRNDRTRAHLTGHATLAHSMGRSWSTSVSYNRNVGFIDGVLEPVLTDRVSGQVSGQVSRRVGASAQASAVRGDRGGSERTYLAYNAGGQLTVLLSRRVGLGAGYAYRYAEYDADAFIVVPDLRQASQVYTRVTFSPIQLISLGVSYSYALYERNRDQLFGRFDRHAVVLTAGISAPLLARTRGTNASR